MCPPAPDVPSRSVSRVNLQICVWRSAQPEWSNTELFLPRAKTSGGGEQTNQFQIKYMPTEIGSHLLKPV